MEQDTSQPPDEFIEGLRAEIRAEQERLRAQQAKAQEPPEPPEPPASIEQAVPLGKVVVLGSSHMQGHTVIVSQIPTATPRLYATMGMQPVDGSHRMAAYFPRVPEGTYSVHQAANYTRIDVYGGEITLVDWSHEGGFW